jgi:hypothetical protein
MAIRRIILAAMFAALGISAWAQEAPLPGAGKMCELDLGKKRVNWTHAKWQVLPLDGVRDLSGAAGLRIVVTTDQPRGDAGVYVAVREADGSWYEHPWAVNGKPWTEYNKDKETITLKGLTGTVAVTAQY